MKEILGAILGAATVVGISLAIYMGIMVIRDSKKFRKKMWEDDLAHGRWQVNFNRRLEMEDPYLGLRPDVADAIKREEALKTLPGQGGVH